MIKDAINYDQWIVQSLLGVVQRALKLVETNGLPGKHHFFITFQTDAEGVSMPKSLKAQHPKEMTIVFQNQYDNLQVGADGFEVTLRFGGRPAHLCIPFAAITFFTDPSVNFGLQFKDGAVSSAAADAVEDQLDQKGEGPEKQQEKQQEKHQEKPLASEPMGEVIALDAFRKR